MSGNRKSGPWNDCLHLRCGKATAFTLVELMVVVLIVAILAAVAIPMYTGRVEMSKWTEAHTAAGTIGTGIRTYYAEKGPSYTGYAADLEGNQAKWGTLLGISSGDLIGTYFNPVDYSIVGGSVGVGADGRIRFSVQVTASKAGGPTGTRTFDQDGNWN
jgi:prepilin-type N-terminal cleavage/methylation domain-containing protein